MSMTPSEILRARKRLPAEEVERLLRDLPALLDEPVNCPPGDLLYCLAVRVDGSADSSSRAPITEWPPFTLAALHLPVGGLEATALEVRADAAAPVRLARLVYELLGGRREVLSRDPPPAVAALNEAGNLILSRGLQRGAFRTSAEFWEEWKVACDIAAPLGLSIPGRWLQTAHKGKTLRIAIDSPAGAAASVSFVARPQFVVGRSSRLADLVVRFPPDTAENRERTSEISRVHSVLEIGSEGLSVRDGDGATASRNGSRWQGEPLGPSASKLIGDGGVLRLGSVFAVNVRPLWESRPAIAIGNLCQWLGFEPAAPKTFSDQSREQVRRVAAVLFEPVTPLPGERAIWLLDRLEFRAGTDALQWAPELVRSGDAPAFVYAHGAFWLQAGTASPLELDGTPLHLGDIAPLAASQRLRAGSLDCALEVRDC